MRIVQTLFPKAEETTSILDSAHFEYIIYSVLFEITVFAIHLTNERTFINLE